MWTPSRPHKLQNKLKLIYESARSVRLTALGSLQFKHPLIVAGWDGHGARSCLPIAAPTECSLAHEDMVDMSSHSI